MDNLVVAGFTVSALTRDASKSTFPAEVRIIVSDYTSESLTEAFRDQDAIVSTVGTYSTTEQLRIIDCAVNAGVKRFLPSEFGIDTSDPRIVDVLPPAKMKYDTVQYLKTKQEKLSWTAVIVGGFFDWALMVGALGCDIRNRKVTVFDGGDKSCEFTNIETIAKTVAAVLSADHYDETSNRYVYVNSFTVTQNQIVTELEKATGASFARTHVKAAEVAEEARRQLATGEFESIGGSPYVKGSVSLITAQVHNLDGLNHYSQTRGLWNQRLGLAEEDFEATIREVVRLIG